MNNEIVTFDSTDLEKNKNTGLLIAIIPILFFLPLAAADMKSSAYLKFAANQALILILCSVAAGIVGAILGIIPVIGGIMGWVISAVVLVLYVLNIVNTVNKPGTRLPFVGGIEILK